MGLTLSKVYDFCMGCCRGQKKRRRRTDQRKRTQKATINSYWETMNEKGSLTPSQIPDDMLTREVHFKDKKRGTSISESGGQFQFDKFVLETEGYEMIDDSHIGKGGSGKVYKVKHKTTGQILAAKVTELVKKEFFSQSRFESFKNEIFVLRRNPHKYIIQLKDHFLCNQTISFIIMEFGNGGSLDQRLRKKQHPFPEEEAKSYFVQISNAIYYLHSKGIVHGDLKLPNVLISIIGGKEMIKITDFGCSRVVYRKDTGIVMKTKAVGTVSYMSPEQIIVYIASNLKQPELVKNRYKRYNPFKADMWALGVCLFKLVHFQRPFKCNDKKDPKDLLNMLQSMQSGFLLRSTIFRQLSNDCIDLLKGLLEYDRFKRMDVKVLMTTKWVLSSDKYDLKGDK